MNSIYIFDQETCIMCGAPIPEGRQVCILCEKAVYAEKPVLYQPSSSTADQKTPDER